jgi:hypothetical protein
MSKPEIKINLNLNIDIDKFVAEAQLPEGPEMPYYEKIIESINSLKLAVNETEPTKSPEKSPLDRRLDEDTTRHQKAVTANQRISDAIEFINQRMKAINGANELSGEKKTLEKLKVLLLGL